MFQPQNARGQRGTVVVGQGGHGGLDDDRTVVHYLIHEMHGAAGHAHAVGGCVGRAVGAGKAGQNRRVDVQHAAREGVQKSGGEDAHEAGQRDGAGSGFHAVVADDARKLGVEGLAGGEVRVGQGHGVNAVLARALQAVGPGLVGNHNAHFGVQKTGVDLVENGLQIGTAAGDQHGKRHGHGSLPVARLRPRPRRARDVRPVYRVSSRKGTAGVEGGRRQIAPRQPPEPLARSFATLVNRPDRAYHYELPAGGFPGPTRKNNRGRECPSVSPSAMEPPRLSVGFC